MAEAFQVSCVARSETNWGHRHITGIGTVAKPGSPDRWHITAVLGRIAGGDLFYALNASGDLMFVHAFRCWCGTETVRTTGGDDVADDLDTLAPCEWELGHESSALPPFTASASGK